MEVTLIAKTVPTPALMRLAEGQPWSKGWDTVTEEIPMEFAGRACYRSWGDDSNPNVTKIRVGTKRYLQNILTQRHGSVLEHCSGTFWVQDCSRVLTHELVRHRAGCAYSQESLRYVRLDHFELVIPEEHLGHVPEGMQETMEDIRRRIKGAIDEMNWADLAFKRKKELTSFLRRFIPMGVKTNIVFTANLRALRHILAMRGSEHAEVEIRGFAKKLLPLCKTTWPTIFGDISIQEGHIVATLDKV